MRAYPRADRLRWPLLPQLVLAATLAQAEPGRMTVVVQTPAHEPLANVRIGVAGVGSIESTDVGGRARLQLASQTRVGTHLRLQVVPPPQMVFVSPFEGDAIVPSFENESGNFLAVILIRPGDRAALSNGVTLSGMIRQSQQQVNAAVRKKASSSSSTKPLRFVAYEAEKTDTPPPTGRTPSIGVAKQLPLITDDVANRLGFSRVDVEAALKGWALDPLAWKMVMTSALFEFGREDPFSSSFVEPTFGVHFGLGGWSMASNLREVWRRFREADRARFDAIMGKDADEVAAWLAGKVGPGASLAKLDRPKEPSPGRRVDEPWKTRFARLGGWAPYQRIQVEQMRPFLDAAAKRASAAGFRSERARAYFYDLVVHSGSGVGMDRLLDAFALDVLAFQQQLHRTPDEQEALLLLTNRWMQRFENKPFARSFRTRREFFALGQGRVADRTGSLEDVGIRMRDVDTGVEIPLSGDRATLDRLKSGWLPVRAAA